MKESVVVRAYIIAMIGMSRSMSVAVRLVVATDSLLAIRVNVRSIVEMSESTEQWETNGKCNVCRRRDYCSKPCKAYERRREHELRCIVARALLRANLGVDKMEDNKNGR